MVPNQKEGVEIPVKEIVVNKLSSHESLCRAAAIPNGIPMIQANSIEKIARLMVFGNLTASSDAIGCLVIYEVPKSPLNKLAR